MKKLHFIICMIILALMSLSIGPTGQALAESLSDDFENPPLDLNTWEILTTGGTVEVTQDGSLGVLLLSGGGQSPS